MAFNSVDFNGSAIAKTAVASVSDVYVISNEMKQANYENGVKYAFNVQAGNSTYESIPYDSESLADAARTAFINSL